MIKKICKCGHDLHLKNKKGKKLKCMTVNCKCKKFKEESYWSMRIHEEERIEKLINKSEDLI